MEMASSDAVSRADGVCAQHCGRQGAVKKVEKTHLKRFAVCTLSSCCVMAGPAQADRQWEELEEEQGAGTGLSSSTSGRALAAAGGMEEVD